MIESTYRGESAHPPVVEVYYWSNPVGLPDGHQAHEHPTTLEICAIERGRLSWWVGDETLDVHPGDIVVMMPGVPHGSTDGTLQPSEYTVVHLDPKLLSDELRAALPALAKSAHHPAQRYASELIRRIFEEHAAPKAFSGSAVQSLATLLLTTLIRNSERSTQESDNYLVKRAMRLFLNPDRSPMTVEEVATELHISPVWLTRVFQTEIGQTPAEWFRSQKMHLAKRLLSDPSHPIGDVAMELGYASSQYFATAFRRETGMTPTAYRQRSAEERRASETSDLLG